MARKLFLSLETPSLARLNALDRESASQRGAARMRLKGAVLGESDPF